MQYSTPDSIILYRGNYLKKIRHLAETQIKFWDDRIAEISSMDRETLIEKVIAAERIEGKFKYLKNIWHSTS